MGNHALATTTYLALPFIRTEDGSSRPAKRRTGRRRTWRSATPAALPERTTARLSSRALAIPSWQLRLAADGSTDHPAGQADNGDEQRFWLARRRSWAASTSASRSLCTDFGGSSLKVRSSFHSIQNRSGHLWPGLAKAVGRQRAQHDGFGGRVTCRSEAAIRIGRMTVECDEDGAEFGTPKHGRQPRCGAGGADALPPGTIM